MDGPKLCLIGSESQFNGLGNPESVQIRYALDIDGLRLTHSPAVIEYLDETRPEPLLLPADPAARQHVRAMAHLVAMGIHPVCNLNVASRVVDLTDGGDAVRTDWMQHFTAKGLSALEELVAQAGPGSFCYGDMPTIADLCLIPQLYNAHRWGVDTSSMTRLSSIEKNCQALESFQEAVPEMGQPAT